MQMGGVDAVIKGRTVKLYSKGVKLIKLSL